MKKISFSLIWNMCIATVQIVPNRSLPPIWNMYIVAITQRSLEWNISKFFTIIQLLTQNGRSAMLFWEKTNKQKNIVHKNDKNHVKTLKFYTKIIFFMNVMVKKIIWCENKSYWWLIYWFQNFHKILFLSYFTEFEMPVKIKRGSIIIFTINPEAFVNLEFENRQNSVTIYLNLLFILIFLIHFCSV